MLQKEQSLLTRTSLTSHDARSGDRRGVPATVPRTRYPRLRQPDLARRAAARRLRRGQERLDDSAVLPGSRPGQVPEPGREGLPGHTGDVQALHLQPQHRRQHQLLEHLPVALRQSRRPTPSPVRLERSSASTTPSSARTSTLRRSRGESCRSSAVLDASATRAWPMSPTPAKNSTPLYRFYNKKTGAHFYTASAAERDQRPEANTHRPSRTRAWPTTCRPRLQPVR